MEQFSVANYKDTDLCTEHASGIKITAVAIQCY